MIELSYLSENKIPLETYHKFLHQYYRNDEITDRLKRLNWYLEKGNNFKVLLATVNGELVGQTCAFKCTAIYQQKEIDWWWGVDNFVIATMRGKGIGKKLQAKLHHDLINFSSAWYSPSNGHIKQKLGSLPFCKINFNYYPINNYVSILVKILINKYFNKNIRTPNILPFKYLQINSILKKEYIYKEINLQEKLLSTSNFIAKSLNDYDFYIKRDTKYLTWKYLLNPNLRFHTLEIYNKDKLEAILMFSTIHNKKLLITPIKAVTLLDIFISKDSKFTNKDALLIIGTFYKNKKQKFDGIFALQNAKYFPFFRYPINGSFVLSTIKNNSIKPYLGYSDQDMEQMI